MPDIYLQNNGRPDLAPDRRRPFPLPAARASIPVGGRLAITDEVLRHHGYAEGSESARNFATFLAGVYNGNREPTWLDVIETDAAPPETPTGTPDDPQTPDPDTAGDPGLGENA